MALATQCPFCQTTFRVAQDQLKLRGGLVRCGNCKEVFNGNDHLVAPETAQQLVATPAASAAGTAKPAPTTPPSAWPPLPGATASTPPSAPAALPATPPLPPSRLPAPDLSAAFASIAAETRDAPWGNDTTAAADPLPEAASINTLTQELSYPVPQTSSAPAADAATVLNAQAQPLALEEDNNDAALDAALNQLAADTGAPVGLLKQATRDDEDDHADEQATEATEATEPEPVDAVLEEEEDDTAQDAEDDEDAPVFVQRAERRERLRGVLRIIMTVGAVLLSVTLLLQALYLWRNQVAAWLPPVRPLLSAVCAKLHCTVGLPTNIEQLSLESSELQLVPPNQNIYTLSLLLRNRGYAAQAWPYMELTLNDGDEKAITRRVFTPREYLSSPRLVDDGFGGESEQQVKLTFELSQPAASGYRIYLFFP